MTEQLQRIVEKEEGACKHNKIIITGQFPLEDNPQGERRQLYYAECINPQCNVKYMLGGLRSWNQTDKTYSTYVVYERKK